MVLEIIPSWKYSWLYFCFVLVQSVTVCNQRALPLLHGCMGWNDSDLLAPVLIQRERRHCANAY